ncbi:hypothetical protein CORC01_13423, partial [Colletotrichum orchidophilum]
HPHLFSFPLSPLQAGTSLTPRSFSAAAQHQTSPSLALHLAPRPSCVASHDGSHCPGLVSSPALQPCLVAICFLSNSVTESQLTATARNPPQSICVTRPDHVNKRPSRRSRTKHCVTTTPHPSLSAAI